MKWQYLIIISILIGLVLIAGCTDEDTASVPPPQSSMDTILPGQSLVVTSDVTGDGIAGGTIDTIMVTVSLAPDKRDVDMEKIAVYYADMIKTETLTPVTGFRGEPGQGEWVIVEVKNEVGNTNNRLEDREEFVLRINPKTYLPASRIVTIVIRAPGDINPLTIRRIAPPTILAQGNILNSP
jgi:PBP1b-binding outer membrane lipoprotein LpoB